MPHKIAFIGFGTVGQGLAEVIRQQGPMLSSNLGFQVRIVAVFTPRKGSLYHPDGLDAGQLLDVVHNSGTFAEYLDTPGLERGWDALKIIRESNADTIVEVSPTDIQTGQPAIDYCRAAFASGKNVVTANKGPVALAYEELSNLAKANGVRFGIEGTVMSGTPALRLPLTSLAGADLIEIRGILNGTTNYILTQMEAEQDYDSALAQAQQLGYAETDPTADVEGFDVVAKIVILAKVLLGVPLTAADVSRQGISRLTPADIAQAKAAGKRWKLIGRLKNEGGWVSASVAPEMVPLADPLAHVSGATNAITYFTKLLGEVTLVGAGAGAIETGYSLLIDLINIDRGNI